MSKTITAIFLLMLSAHAKAAAPETFRGFPVKEITHVFSNGEFATLHYAGGRPISESTDRVTFMEAGPSFAMNKDGSDANFRWRFVLDFNDQSVPVNVKIENVGEAEFELLVDERIGIQNMPKGDEDWASTSPVTCKVSRKDACSGWLLESQPHIFVFKATILYIDGKTETLYQGSLIDPAPIASKLGL